jgi:hypothetical protein
MTNRRAATASAIRLARRGATSRGETDLHAYALEKSLASIGVTFAHVRNLRTFPLLAHRCIFSALFRGPLYYSYPQGKGTAYGAYGSGWSATRSAGASVRNPRNPAHTHAYGAYVSGGYGARAARNPRLLRSMASKTHPIATMPPTTGAQLPTQDAGAMGFGLGRNPSTPELYP